MAFGLDLGSLVINLRADTVQFNKAMKAVPKVLKNIGDQATALGRTLSLRLTAPLAAFAGASVFAFGQFDQAITKSTAIMTNVTAELRAEMERTALTISSRTTTSAKDLGDAYFFLASAGLDAKQSIAALDTVNTFAIAGQFDMALATDLLTDAQTALGLSSKDAVENQKQMVRISDVLVKANTIANASVLQFAQSLTADAATASRNFGASLETTVAVLAGYASAGKKGAEAGNLFGRATRLLTKAQRDNGAVFQKFGIEVIDKTTGQYNNLIDIIAQMENAFKDLTKPQRDAALELLGFAALAQKSITPLLGLSDAMKGYEKAVKDANGVTKEITDKQLKAFNAQITITKNQIVNAAIAIGKMLAPAIGFLNEKLRLVIKFWNGFSDSTKRTILIIAAVAAAVGPLLIVFGSLVGVLTILPAIISGVSIALAGLSTAFAFVVPFILPVIAIIAGLIIFWDELVVVFKKVGEVVNAVIIPIWNILASALAPILELVKGLGSLLSEVLGPILSFVAEIVGGILVAAFTILGGILQATVIPVIKLLAFALNFIVGGLRTLVFHIKLVLNWLGSLILKIPGVTSVFEGLKKVLSGNIFEGVGLGIQGFLELLGSASDKIKDLTGGFIDLKALAKGVGSIFESIFDTISKATGGIIDFGVAFEKLKRLFGFGREGARVAAAGAVGAGRVGRVGRVAAAGAEVGKKVVEIANRGKDKRQEIAQTKFQQINLARIGIGGVPVAVKKQEVKATGVEERLDKTNEILQQMADSGVAAVIRP